MVITVEDYEQIRKLWLQGVSQRQIAKRMHISRNTVKKFCAGEAVPWERKAYSRNGSVITEEVEAFILECLEAAKNEDAPKKQRHITAKRIFDMLVERGFAGGETTVRDAVRRLRNKTQEVYVPLEFSPGEAMQVDWGEMAVYLKGEKTKINLFCARLCSSCAPMAAAYRRQNEESFLDAFVRVLKYYGGVPHKAIFDNAKVAVKDGFGSKAIMQAGYAELAAHYGFEGIFCNPESGHEKGLVEGLVGYIRRNVCVPMPRVDSIEELNNLLEQRCRKYLNHQIRGKAAKVGVMFEAEQQALWPLPIYEYEAAKKAISRVDSYSTIRYDTNRYSVDIHYCGKEVTVQATAETIKIIYEGKVIGEHQRCYERHKSKYKLEHYLPLLARKGRAIFNAKPVRDNLPAEFLEWLQKQDLTAKQLVEIMYRGLEEGWNAVQYGVSNKPPKEPVIKDVVIVQEVDLSAYDELFDRTVVLM